MTYRRIIPRDLFNEADLLKCLGRLYIALDNLHDHKALFAEDEDGVERFVIEQDESSGGIYVENLTFVIKGEPHQLYRPLNARTKWPLYVTHWRDIDERVFDGDGALTPEFLELIR